MEQPDPKLIGDPMASLEVELMETRLVQGIELTEEDYDPMASLEVELMETSAIAC